MAGPGCGMISRGLAGVRRGGADWYGAQQSQRLAVYRRHNTNNSYGLRPNFARRPGDCHLTGTRRSISPVADLKLVLRITSMSMIEKARQNRVKALEMMMDRERKIFLGAMQRSQRPARFERVSAAI
jgi:hypothetical protein